MQSIREAFSLQGQKKEGVASIAVRERRENTFLRCKDCFFDLVADCGHVFSVEAFPRSDVDMDALSSVHQNNLARSVGLVERDDVVSQAEWRSIFSSAQLPVVHGQEAGDSPAEAAEGDTVVGELNHQWSYLGGWREVPGDVLVRNG